MKFLLPIFSAFAASAAARNLFQQLADIQAPIHIDNARVPGDSPVEYCRVPAEEVVFIQRLDVIPNPPISGRKMVVEATVLVEEEITQGAYVDVVVKLGMVLLFRRRFDICENVGQVDMECPIRKGRKTIRKEVDIPAGLPAGPFFVTAAAYTVDDADLTCLTAKVVFGAN